MCLISSIFFFYQVRSSFIQSIRRKINDSTILTNLSHFGRSVGLVLYFIVFFSVNLRTTSQTHFDLHKCKHHFIKTFVLPLHLLTNRYIYIYIKKRTEGQKGSEKKFHIDSFYIYQISNALIDRIQTVK